jgi:hypothetical protein
MTPLGEPIWEKFFSKTDHYPDGREKYVYRAYRTTWLGKKYTLHVEWFREIMEVEWTIHHEGMIVYWNTVPALKPCFSASFESAEKFIYRTNLPEFISGDFEPYRLHPAAVAVLSRLSGPPMRLTGYLR